MSATGVSVGQSPSKLKDRIVSLHKPYLRPIVRGKENKPVEFGAKAHILQVDGLAFIDKLDFNAFNECTRLKLSVAKHKRFFGPAKQLGADRIYATNKNRVFCTEQKIFTCFPKKGPKKLSKAEKTLSSEISKQRATVMEGVFWNKQKPLWPWENQGERGEKRETDDIFWDHGSKCGSDCKKKSRKRKSSPTTISVKTTEKTTSWDQCVHTTNLGLTQAKPKTILHFSVLKLTQK